MTYCLSGMSKRTSKAFHPTAVSRSRDLLTRDPVSSRIRKRAQAPALFSRSFFSSSIPRLAGVAPGFHPRMQMERVRRKGCFECAVMTGLKRDASGEICRFDRAEKARDRVSVPGCASRVRRGALFSYRRRRPTTRRTPITRRAVNRQP